MSLKQFENWLRERGIERKADTFYVPCTGSARQADTANASDDASRRTLTVTISSNLRDRHGDIIEPAGADLAAFRRNPVVLWAHHCDEFPIARADAVWVEGDKLMARVTFDTSPFAREAQRLYAEGFLSGWSVGCLPRHWEIIEDEKGKFVGYHITAWELVELSAVPVPANPDALTRELRDGRIADARLCKDLGAALDRAAPDALAPAPAAESGIIEPANAPEISVEAMAEAILPRLLDRLREWAAATAEREIRRRQGRL